MMRVGMSIRHDAVRASGLLVCLFFQALFVPATAADLSGVWKVTVAQHQHPSGRTIPATTGIHVFDQLEASVSLQAARAYTDAKLESGTLRASRDITLTAQDVGPIKIPGFVGEIFRIYLVGWLSPDGRRIDARDQHIGVVSVPTDDGQYGARAVRYSISVTMERLDFEFGFVRAGQASADFVRRVSAGEELRLLARFAEPVPVERIDAQLSAGGTAEKIRLVRDNADASRFWSELLAGAPNATAGTQIEYVAVMGPMQAAVSVAAPDPTVRAFCPKFLYDAIIDDYDDETPQQCGRPNLPDDLRGDSPAATARSMVRFERQMRQNSTLSWDLPKEVRISSSCPSVSGRPSDEDAWLRMRTAAEYFVARRRLTDGIMSGLESLASLDALSAMQCGVGAVGVTSGAHLLKDVECSRFAGVPGGSDACTRLQTQCPTQQSFSALIDETELAFRQEESVAQAIAALANQSGTEAQKKREQLRWVQQMTGSMNPWLQGEQFQSAYQDALAACRSSTGAGAGLCDDQGRGFVCEGMKAQASATAVTIRQQIDMFAQAMACIESREGQCELSPSEFRDVVRRAPPMSKLPATRVAAPQDRGSIGFMEFMVADIDCRAEMEAISEEQQAAIRDFAIGATLTVATAGLGSVAARVALTASRARSAGLAMDAARAATMANRLERAALAIDVIDMGYGVADGIAQCDDVFKESSAIPPVNVAGPRCPVPDRYDGPQLTGHYRSCVLRAVALNLATAGLVALPAGVSRVMDDSAVRRAAEALQLPPGAIFSAQQREALLQVFRKRLAGSLDTGLESAEAILRSGGFDETQIRALFAKLAPDVRVLGTKLVQGIEGDVIRHVRVGEHTLAVTRVRGVDQILSCSFCTVLLKLKPGEDVNPRALENLAALGARMGLERASPSVESIVAFKNIITAVNGSADPAAALAAVGRIPSEVLKNATDMLSSSGFYRAIRARPERAAALFDQFARNGDQAISLLSRLPSSSSADDVGDLLDLLAVPDVAQRLAGLVARSDAPAVMAVARAAAQFGRSVPEGQANDWITRMLRLADDVAAAGPAVGSERRMWATMTDVAVARDRLGSAKFAEYLDAIDFFRRSDGHTPGVIRNAQGRETANLQDVISGEFTNPINNALELVGTKWLIESGTKIRVLAGRGSGGTALSELPVLSKSNVTGFGTRVIRTPGTTRTIEADTALSLVPGQAGGGAGAMDIVLDWKNYGFSGVLNASDINKALEALDSGAVSNVLFLSPRPWSAETLQRIQQLNRPGLMLGTVTPDANLLRFLDEPIP